MASALTLGRSRLGWLWVPSCSQYSCPTALVFPRVVGGFALLMYPPLELPKPEAFTCLLSVRLINLNGLLQPVSTFLRTTLQRIMNFHPCASLGFLVNEKRD